MQSKVQTLTVQNVQLEPGELLGYKASHDIRVTPTSTFTELFAACFTHLWEKNTWNSVVVQ